MMTTAIYGVPVAPAALANEKGNVVVVQTVANIHSLEHILRPVRPAALHEHCVSMYINTFALLTLMLVLIVYSL